MPYESHTVETAVGIGAARAYDSVPAPLCVLPLVAPWGCGIEPCGVGGADIVIIGGVLCYEALPLAERDACLTARGCLNGVIEVTAAWIFQPQSCSPCAPLAVHG